MKQMKYPNWFFSRIIINSLFGNTGATGYFIKKILSYGILNCQRIFQGFINDGV